MRSRHIWLLLGLVLGQALFVLHAAEHPLAAAADYDCAVCGHGFDGQQALAASPPSIPQSDPFAALAPLAGSQTSPSPTLNRPPIRGPPAPLV